MKSKDVKVTCGAAWSSLQPWKLPKSSVALGLETFSKTMKVTCAGAAEGWKPSRVPKNMFGTLQKETTVMEGPKKQYRTRLGDFFEDYEGDMRRRCGGLEAFEGAKKHVRNPTKRNYGHGRPQKAVSHQPKKRFRKPRKKLRPWTVPKSSFAPGFESFSFEGSEGDMRRRCGGLEAFEGAKKQFRNPTKRNCGGLELEAFEGAKKQFRSPTKRKCRGLELEIFENGKKQFRNPIKRNCGQGR